jgi:hypothetical protein
MFSFPKRHWLALYCGLALLAFGMVDLNWQRGTAPSWHVGLSNGYLFCCYKADGFLFGPDNPPPGLSFWRFAFHPPRIGGWLHFYMRDGFFSLELPLWLWGTMIAFWLVMRQRFQARTIDSNPPEKPSTPS